MAKFNSSTVLSEELVKQYAAELRKLGRQDVPPPVRKLFSDERSQVYYEGLLTGYAHARFLGELIALVVKAGPARPQSVELLYSRHIVIFGGRTLQLRPVDFAFYAVMARRRLAERGFVAWDMPKLADEYLHEYRRVLPEWNGNRAKVEKKLERDGIEQQWFEERKSNVNRAILSLGELFARDYRIVSEGTRPNTRSGLSVAPGSIRIRDGPSFDSMYAVAADPHDNREARSHRRQPCPFNKLAARRIALLSDIDSRFHDQKAHGARDRRCA